MNTNTEIGLRKYVAASWVIVAVNFVVAGIAVILLPATVATHFGMDGNPDKQGSKMMVLFLPLITLAVNIFFQFITNRPVEKLNYPVEITPQNAERQYSLAKYFLAIMRVIVLSVMVLTNGMTIGSMFIGRADTHMMFVFMALVMISVIIPAVIYGIKATKMK